MLLTRILTLLAVPLTVAAQTTLPTGNPTVSIAAGTLVGSYRNSYGGDVFESYQGIPYAAPPVGELRFQSPQDPPAWGSDTLDVSGIATAKCVQDSSHDDNDDEALGFDATASEDCLYLNIYVHESSETSNKPVIFYIHGGSYVWGDNKYTTFGPELFMDHDIVLVQVNYRLGPFGFLSLGDPECPGNQGLRDQAKALRWVADNIAAFGGDPDNVTIMGESAGSWSVFYHLFSPLSAGLFKKAALLSGTLDFFVSWRSMSEEEGIAAGIGFAEAMGCPQSDTSERIACLRGVDVSAVYGARYANDQPDDVIPAPPPPYLGYTGVVDAGYMDQGDVFLPDIPVALMESGNFNSDVSIVVGTVKDEGFVAGEILVFVPALYSIMGADWEYYGPYFLLGELGEASQQQIDICDAAAEFYFGGIENFNEAHLSSVIDMLTDSFFLYGTHKFTEAASQAITGEVFQYQYTYNGEHHWMDLDGLDGGALGVNHADDLFSVFYPFVGYGDTAEPPAGELNAEDEAVALRHVSMWARFAQDGGDALKDEFGWDPVTADDHRYLRIDTDLTMEASDYYNERMAFWRQFEPYE